MSDVFAEGDCRYEYLSGLTLKPILCTIIIVWFTILLEVAVACGGCAINDGIDRTSPESAITLQEGLLRTSTVTEQPHSQPSLQLRAPEHQANDKAPDEAETKPAAVSNIWCLPNAPPRIRANRLIMALILYTAILTAFSIRMHDVVNPYISPECNRYFPASSIPRNWWFTVLLNILPFVTATFSFMRAVVDCYLVRWNSSLSWGKGDGSEAVR